MGDITIECRNPKCHAALVLTVADLWASSIMRCLRASRWDPETQLCEDCADKAEAGEDR